MSTDNTDHSRRRVLQSLGAASAAALAGCGGGGQDQQTPTEGGEGEGTDAPEQDPEEEFQLGERVPKISMEYFSNMSVTPIIEQMMNFVQQDLDERLGVNTEPKPTELVTEVANVIGGERTTALPHMIIRPKPQRIDPHPLVNHLRLRGTGFGVGGGISNWGGDGACEYSDLAFRQMTESDQGKRQEFVTEALNLSTDHVAFIPLTNPLVLNLYNKNVIDASRVGRLGANPQNPMFFIESSPKQGDTIVGQTLTVTLNSIQSTRHQDGNHVWGNLINSGLRMYDENLEAQNVLADTIETEREGSRIIVELIDDAVFHNGDPVTSEDVKFTFDYIIEHPAGATEYQQWPHDSIEVVDERTTQFDLQTAAAPLLTNINFAMAGVWHKESMIEAGATENPAEYSFDDAANLIGSGPFRLTNAEPGSSLRLEPFEDHPVFSPEHNIQLQGFANKQTAIQSFKNGDLHTLFGIKPLVFDNLKQQDKFGSVATKGWTTHGIYPQFPFPPTQFKEFRHAVTLSIDRERINQVAQGGIAEPQLHGGTVPTTHAWHEADKVDNVEGLDQPSGNPQKAKQVLRDAGWGWDDNDNLHYPADIDLTPMWPKGQSPDPANYPCLNDEGEYVVPDER